MRKFMISLGFITLLLYLLSALQSGLYFLPLPIPAFWVIIFCYVSFYRNLFKALIFNMIIAAVICQFSAIAIAPLVVVLNVMTVIAKLLQDRFHLDDNQILLSIGLFSLGINIGLLFLDTNSGDLYHPHIWAWIGEAVMTAAISPFIFYPVLKLDQYIHHEPIDHLEQLFV